MYTIDKTSYGYKIMQDGAFDVEEVERYKWDVIDTLTRHRGTFSLMIDSRRLALPTPDVLEIFGELHKTVWQMSCERVSIIVMSPVAKGMAVQACSDSPVDSNDRVIDARKYPDWEARALTWIVDAIEPESREVAGECDVSAVRIE